MLRAGVFTRSASPYLGLVLLVLAAVGVLAAMATRGATSAAAVHLLYFALAVTLPGALLLKALAPPRFDLLETLGLGTVVGLCWELAGWAVFTGLGLGRWLVLWPVLTVVALLATPAVRRRLAVPLQPASLRSNAGILLVAVLAVLAFYRSTAPVPQPSAGAGFSYYPDLIFHLSFVHETVRAAPPMDPALSGEPLRYHWFPDAHLAAAVDMTGIDPALLLFRTWLGPVIAAYVVAAAALTRQVTRTWWAGILGATMVGLTAGLGPALPSGAGLYLNPMSYLSPSQTLGSLIAIGLVSSLVGVLWQGWGRGGVVLLVLTAAASAGAKPTTLPLVLGGLAVAVAAGVAQRRLREVRWAALVAGGLVLLTVLASGTVTGSNSVPFRLLGVLRSRLAYRGVTGDTVGPDSGTWIVGGLLHPTPRILLWLALILAASVVSLVVFALVTAAAASRAGRHRLELWFVAGAVVSCLVPLTVIDHPGVSELYFVGAVAPLVPVGVAALLHEALRRLPRSRRRVLLAASAVTGFLLALGIRTGVLTRGDGAPGRTTAHLASALLTIGIVVVLLGVLGWALGRRAGWRGAGAVLAVGVVVGGSLAVGQGRALTRPPAQQVAVKNPRLGWTADQIEAALWLSRHARSDDVVASDTACLPGRSGCDTRGWLVSGIGGTRALLEGWAYNSESMSASVAGRHYTQNPSPWPDRVRLIDEVNTAPTEATLRALEDRHVTLVFADAATSATARSTLDRLADRIHANATVTVYRLR